MGISCSCRTKSGKVIDVYRYDPTFASVNFTSKSQEVATMDLAVFYEKEKAEIPYKLLFYYIKVLEASCQYERAIILKISNIGAVGMQYLVKLLPFYTHIDELHLWKVHLTSDALGMLIDSLYLIPKLRILNLEDNKLKDDALLNLCRGFAMISNLEELWLSVNEMSASGARVLADALAVLTHLRTLALNYNYLRDAGCEAICQTLATKAPLHCLALAGNQLTSASVPVLCNLAQTSHPLSRCDLTKNEFVQEDYEKLNKAFTPDILKL